MNIQVIKQIKAIIKELGLDCDVKEFKDEVDWDSISMHQNLSEEFIREFKDRVVWDWISKYQNLSEEFIKEFKDRVDWNCISMWQDLSEDFIREFKDEVNWYWISKYQNLSLGFIREFKDEVNWDSISKYQKLSEGFIKEFKDKINIKVYKEVHKKKSINQKRKEVKAYCEKYGLEFDGKYLYAYRNHDKLGRGMVMPTRYKKGVYYLDWHCDMRENERYSFGFGIFPLGNTKVRVKIKDWGVEVKREDGKARVKGFEIS